VKVNRPGVRLEYRPGYYAPADFRHSGKEDRERELQEQVSKRLTGYRRGDVSGCFLLQAGGGPVLCAGFADCAGVRRFPFVKGGDRDKATLDVVGGSD